MNVYSNVINELLLFPLRAGLRLVLILEPMLGIPWLFGLFYQSAVFSYIFVILNTLQVSKASYTAPGTLH